MIFVIWLGGPLRSETRLTVFAAASMQNVMEEIISAFEPICGCSVVLSTAGSSVLARQIEAGAPADIFVSADLLWMDYLVERNLVQAEDVTLIAGNQLDIAVAKSEAPVSDPKSLLDGGRFAMADPETVPAGRYAKAALESLGIWEEVRRNAVFTENVRVALKMAARGDVQAAIVYGSDIPLEPALHTGFEFADSSHPPIVYPAGEIRNGSADATKFLEFLGGETAQALLRQSGFSNLVPAEN